MIITITSEFVMFLFIFKLVIGFIIIIIKFKITIISNLTKKSQIFTYFLIIKII